MKNRISEYQSKLFNKLFVTLPYIKKNNDFNKNSNFDFKINYFYYFPNKDFWFSRSEKKDKIYFLFGLCNKPLNDIHINDTCLIIDFDKNIQFNNTCLGLFRIKNSEIHILINNNLLKERCPNISISDFKIDNIKSFDGSIDLDIIDLGDLDNVFIGRLENLIKSSFRAKPQNGLNHQKIKKDSVCQICSKNINDFKLDSNLNHLKNLKKEFCGNCIEKIIVSEFYTKIAPYLKGNETKELSIAKEKFGNDQVFDIGLNLLEKYNIIRYIGVKKLFYIIDRDSYLVKKYIKFSDKNELLIDNIAKINEIDQDLLEEYENKEINRKIFFENFKSGKTKEESAENSSLELYLIDKWYLEGSEDKKPFVEFYNKYIEIVKNKKQLIPKVVKTDSLGNKIIINQMNIILEDLTNGKTDDEAIGHAKVSKNTYNYWINRGKQDFGDIYVQFYQYINGIKSGEYESDNNGEINDNSIEEERSLIGLGIYEPLLEEYEYLFSSMNQTGIAWVDKIGDMWIYSRNINGETITLNANDLYELYEQVMNNDLIWGIRDYDKAKEFIDFPDDFEIPEIEIEERFGEIDQDIYKPLSEVYEKSFSSMNQSGIAWVNQIGSKLYYVKSSGGKNIRLSGEDIYDLYKKVKKAKQIWGVRDYDRAKKFIDFPDDFEIPLKPQIDEDTADINIDVDPGIYAPLPIEYERSFKHTPMNQSGIAWVSLVGKRWKYGRINKGKTIEFYDENIYELYKKVRNAKQIWGVRDYDRAKKFIDFPDDFEIPLKPQIDEDITDFNIEVDSGIYAPLPIEYERTFNSRNQTGIAWVNQVGNKFYYSKVIGGKSIRLSGKNVYELYEKVKSVNQIWGIRDYSKASKYIDIPENFEIPKRQNNEISFDKEVNKSIYAPLSQYHLSKFDPNPNNKSGIAWVNKLGNNWVYQRQRNGKTVRISDSNIIKLHEKVIKNNQIWGIIDIDKARKAIETNSIDDKQYSKLQKTSHPIKTNSKVTVTFIEKSKNEFEILIKGLIKNKDLMDVLSRLDLFKENIKRIVANSINKELDIFIELIINKKALSTFEEQIIDLGWKINK